MLMDATQALKDTENSLRDFIAEALHKTYGDAWTDLCGVSAERLNKWKTRKDEEQKRQETGVVEERLLYYADFYDVKNILKKNWDKVPEFSAALGDWKTLEVWLSELEKLRDPDAHRRELLPHQKHLAMGIAGEVRTRIIRYRGGQATPESYFPKIESARDNLGNIWIPRIDHTMESKISLRVGDTVDFVITATDPLGEALQYCFVQPVGDLLWQEEPFSSWTVEHYQVGRGVDFLLMIISGRDYHARSQWDDVVIFKYDVLPVTT